METGQKDQLFLILISQLSHMAWLGMGKAENPMTGKIERDLDMARFQIDMIGMLSEKTQGHLNETESQFLEQTLTQTRLAFVEEMKNEPSGSTEGTNAKDSAGETEAESEGSEKTEKAEKTEGEDTDGSRANGKAREKEN